MDMKKLKGVAVVSVASRRRIGVVDDALLDAGSRRVVALLVDDGASAGRRVQVLPYLGIESIGAEAVMARDEHALKSIDSTGLGEYRPFSSLLGTKVVTDTGDTIGTVATAHLEPKSGALTEIEIGHSGLGGLLKANTIVDASTVTSLGDGSVVVPRKIAETAP